MPNLTHPGGNITGFANPEFSIAGKWADLLKQMAPSNRARGTLAVRAARHVAPEIPIVFLAADPIGAGIVTNLSRPGGNVTGVSVMRLSGKWPELAKEALPGLSRVGYLINPTKRASPH